MIIPYSTQLLGSTLSYRKSLIPQDEPIPTSAQYFTFSEFVDSHDSYLYSVVSSYIGEDTDIIIPKSYSKNETVIHFPGTKTYLNEYSSWGTSVSGRFSYINYITVSDGVDTAECSTYNEFLQAMRYDLDSSKQKYLVAISFNDGYNGSTIFNTATSYNVFKYPVCINYEGETYTWSSYSATVPVDGTNRTIRNFFRYDYTTNYDANGGDIDAITTTYFDGNDYQVTKIYDYALQYSLINKLTCLSNITSINQHAIEYSDELQEVVLYEGITNLENYCFQYCSKLSKINLPSTLTNIGDYAFRATSLTTVSVPSSVTYLGRRCFGAISTLERVDIYTSYITNPATSATMSKFFGSSSTCVIHIPASVTNPDETYGAYWNYYNSTDRLEYIADL